MKALIDAVLFFVMVVTWIFGFVFAKGTAATIACIFPPYAWYLVAEKFATFWSLK